MCIHFIYTYLYASTSTYTYAYTYPYTRVYILHIITHAHLHNKYAHFFKPPLWNSWTLLGIPSKLSIQGCLKSNFHPRHLDDIACCLALAICLACISPRRWKGDIVCGEEAPKDIEVGDVPVLNWELSSGLFDHIVDPQDWKLSSMKTKSLVETWFKSCGTFWHWILTVELILAAAIINSLPRTYLSTTFLQNLDPSSPPINAQLAVTPNEERLENIKRRRLVLLAQTPISKDEFYTEKKKTCRSNLAQKTWHQPDWYESDPESSTIVSCSSVPPLQKILLHIWAHLSPLHLAQKRK